MNFNTRLIVFSFLFLATIFEVVSGCKKEKQNTVKGLNPQACFTVSDSAPTIYDTIVFSNCSTNADSLVYAFGDGQFSNSANPNHYYTTAGSYQVKLTAFKGTQTSVATKNITVVQGVYGTYLDNDSPCISKNLSIAFCGCQQPAKQFYLSWDVGIYCLCTFTQGLNFSTNSEMPGGALLINGIGSFSNNLDTVKLNFTLIETDQLGNIQTSYCNSIYPRH